MKKIRAYHSAYFSNLGRNKGCLKLKVLLVDCTTFGGTKVYDFSFVRVQKKKITWEPGFNIIKTHTVCNRMFLVSFVYCILQPPPDHLLPATQTHSGGLCLHSPGVQMVQLGDSGLFRWKTLVGICGPDGDSTAAWWSVMSVLFYILISLECIALY